MGGSDRYKRKAQLKVEDEDALTKAAAMFTEEILMAYLTRQPIRDFKKNIKSVNAVMKKDRRFALRITMNDGMPIPIIPMDSQDESHYRRLSPNDRQDFLLNLAVHYLTIKDAKSAYFRRPKTK